MVSDLEDWGQDRMLPQREVEVFAIEAFGVMHQPQRCSVRSCRLVLPELRPCILMFPSGLNAVTKAQPGKAQKADHLNLHALALNPQAVSKLFMQKCQPHVKPQTSKKCPN